MAVGSFLLGKLKPIYVGSCGLGLQPVLFPMLSYCSLVVGFIFCWNNLLKLAKRLSDEPWAGSKEDQGGGGREERKSTVAARWVSGLRK